MIYHAKTQQTPSSLITEKAKASGTYRCKDVLDQLKADFKNKCYICECKEPTSINVEHFKPHKGNRDLEFDWNNLFYCCAHCNNTKLAQTKFDSILNCTVEADGVDSKIKYYLKPFPKEKVDIIADVDEEKVKNTVGLLQEVYNGTTPLKLIESANIRNNILKEIREFQNLLCNFYDDSYDLEERDAFKGKIIRHLKPVSNFTAFKRWIIKENEEMSKDFAQYCG